MIKLPKVFSIVLCEGLVVDPIRGKTSLYGIFHARSYRSFPSPAETITAYVALFGGRGEGTIELRVTHLDTEEQIYSYKRWCVLPGPGVMANIEMKLKQCRFPAPGRYGLSFPFDDNELSDRYIRVLTRGGG
jgi:hypothetical protein